MNDLMTFILGFGASSQVNGLLPASQGDQAETPVGVDFGELIASMLPSDMTDIPIQDLSVIEAEPEDAEPVNVRQNVDDTEVLDGEPFPLQTDGVSQVVTEQFLAGDIDANQSENAEALASLTEQVPAELAAGSNEADTDGLFAVLESFVDDKEGTGPVLKGGEIAGHSDQSMLTVLPVEIISDDSKPAEKTSSHNEIRNTIESIKAEIIVAETLPSADASAATTTESEQNPTAIIRFENSGNTITLPVTLDNINTEDRLTLKFDNKGKAQLSGPVNEFIENNNRSDISDGAMKRAEITVVRAVYISQPEKLLKELNPKSISRDNVVQIHTSNERVSTVIPPVNESNKQTGQGSVRYGYEHAGNTSNSLSGIDIAKQTFSQNATIESFTGDIESQVVRDQTMAAKHMIPVARPVTFAQQVVTPPDAPPAPRFEQVQFKVQIPHSGLRVTEISTFKVSIKPESLGSMRVHLAVVNNDLTAQIHVESAVARNVVESNLNVLRDALAQHGIRVENFTVDISDSGNWNSNPRRNATTKKGRFVREVGAFEESYEPEIAASLVSTGVNLSGRLSLVA